MEDLKQQVQIDLKIGDIKKVTSFRTNENNPATGAGAINKRDIGIRLEVDLEDRLEEFVGNDKNKKALKKAIVTLMGSSGFDYNVAYVTAAFGKTILDIGTTESKGFLEQTLGNALESLGFKDISPTGESSFKEGDKRIVSKGGKIHAFEMKNYSRPGLSSGSIALNFNSRGEIIKDERMSEGLYEAVQDNKDFISSSIFKYGFTGGNTSRPLGLSTKEGLEAVRHYYKTNLNYLGEGDDARPADTLSFLVVMNGDANLAGTYVLDMDDMVQNPESGGVKQNWSMLGTFSTNSEHAEAEGQPFKATDLDFLRASQKTPAYLKDLIRTNSPAITAFVDQKKEGDILLDKYAAIKVAPGKRNKSGTPSLRFGSNRALAGWHSTPSKGYSEKMVADLLNRKDKQLDSFKRLTSVARFSVKSKTDVGELLRKQQSMTDLSKDAHNKVSEIAKALEKWMDNLD